MPFIGPLLPLIVLGIIIWAIVAATRKRREVVTERGGATSARRLFQYAIAYAAFVVAATGLSGLIGNLLSDTVAERGSELAGPLAMTIVGVPVFFALARWIWHTHAADPTERNGVGWALYVNLALITALAAAIGSAFSTAADFIDADWRSAGIAGLVVWTGGWAGHWLAWRRLQPGLLPRLHLWVGSIAGLGVTAVSAGFVLTGLGERVLDAVSSGVAVALTGEDVALAIAGVVIGALVWTWYWALHGLTAERSEGWYVTVLLFGVLGGLAAAVAGAGYGLYLVLEWFLGEPGTTSTVRHFQDLAAPLSALVVGLGVWSYHRAVVGPSAGRARTEIDRIYDYLVAGVGLATLAVSLAVLVVAFFDAVTPAAGEEGSTINTLLAAVTLFVVGAPVWAITWRRVQHLVATDGEVEIGSPTRRTYLFAIFGIGGAVAFGALIACLVLVFEAIFDERTGEELARDVAIPVALLITAAAGAAYHWLVYRAERPVTERAPRRDVLLVGDGPALGAAVAEQAHVRVRTLHRLDLAEGAAFDIEAIVQAIDRAEGEHLLVLAGDDEVRVVPYE